MQDVAIKVLARQNYPDKQLQELQEEVHIMLKLKNHKNVVPLLGIATSPEIALITDYVEGGTLESLILGPTTISWETVFKVTRGACAGMYHLHRENIIHRDLAARNILIRSNFEPVIADFGLSKKLHLTQSQYNEKGFRGPFKWMAPESLSSTTFSTKTDSYSYGIVLWEIVARSAPYPELDIYEAAKQVVQDGLRPIIPITCPAKLGDIMNACWQTDPEKRPEMLKIDEMLQQAQKELVF